MKKIGILSVFLLGLFLYGCGEANENTNINEVENEENIFDNNLKCQEMFYKNQEHLLEEGATDIEVFYSPIKNECWVSYQEYHPEKKENLRECHEDLYISRPLFDKTRNGDYVMYSNSNCFKEGQPITTIIRDVTHSLLDRECISISDVSEEKYDGIETSFTKEKCDFNNVKDAFLEEIQYLKGN